MVLCKQIHINIKFSKMIKKSNTEYLNEKTKKNIRGENIVVIITRNQKRRK